MANKTWLQLSQDLRREAGVQGDGPTAVTNQTGIYNNLVNWINQAWVEVQSLHDNWRFMWNTGQITPTLTGTRDYTLTTTVKRIEPHSVTSTDSSGIISEVAFIDWSLFQEKYRAHTLSADIPPGVCTVTPDGGTLRFADYTSPDYTIDFEYVSKPTKLTLSTSTPTLPEEYESIIVFKALIDYGLFYNAQEAVQHGQLRFTDLLQRLRDDQLIRPTVKLGSFVNEFKVGVSRFI